MRSETPAWTLDGKRSSGESVCATKAVVLFLDWCMFELTALLLGLRFLGVGSLRIQSDSIRDLLLDWRHYRADPPTPSPQACRVFLVLNVSLLSGASWSLSLIHPHARRTRISYVSVYAPGFSTLTRYFGFTLMGWWRSGEKLRGNTHVGGGPARYYTHW